MGLVFVLFLAERTNLEWARFVSSVEEWDSSEKEIAVNLFVIGTIELVLK